MMSKTDAAQIEGRAADAAERAKTALKELPGRARDLTAQARDFTAHARDVTTKAGRRARGEITRRRSAAATRLESLADTVRPPAEARRRTMAVTGGAMVALAATLGAGVAIGVYLSRRLKAKKLEPETATKQAQATAAETVKDLKDRTDGPLPQI
jgi:hypothetical protein